MNKTELSAAIAAKGVAKAPAALNAVLEAIAEGVKKDGKVVIPGFGTFSVTERAARKGINPLTKQEITIAAKKSVKFKAGSGLAL